MLRKLIRRSLSFFVFTAIFTVSLLAQSPLTSLNTLVGNNGSITAGDITFSNFQFLKQLPAPLGVLADFGDIAVSANTNPDGTVSLAFVAVDPVTGAPAPLVTSPTDGGDKIRLVGYTVTVTNPGLRLHSVDQAFGPGTVITGNTNAINGLYTDEPASVLYDFLMFDSMVATQQVTRGAGMPSADGSGNFSGTGGILMPGGNLATYALANEFGLIKGHLGFDPGGTLDSITETFSLVPVGSPVPLVVPTVSTIVIDPAGVASFALNDFAQDGGAVITLASSNPAALALPPSLTISQGYKLGVLPLTRGAVDLPTVVNVSATLNGQTTVQPYTVAPSTPLQLLSVSATNVTTAGTTLLFSLNQENVSDETLLLASSNSLLAPVPASFTIPKFTVPGNFIGASLQVPFQLVSADTPVTFSATFNGITQSTTVVIPKTVDNVVITRAELVVKNGALRVEATGSQPTAVLGLFNAATGQFIGNMSFSGLSGAGAKFSFQGTTGPVTSLLLKSSFSGTATATVTQK